MFCPNCDAKKVSRSKFCVKCGTKIDDIISQPIPQKAYSNNRLYSNRNSKKILFIGLGSAVLVIGVVLLVVLLSSYQSPSKSADELNDYFVYLAEDVFASQLDYYIENRDLSIDDVNAEEVYASLSKSILSHQRN